MHMYLARVLVVFLRSHECGLAADRSLNRLVYQHNKIGVSYQGYPSQSIARIKA